MAAAAGAATTVEVVLSESMHSRAWKKVQRVQTYLSRLSARQALHLCARGRLQGPPEWQKGQKEKQNAQKSSINA